MANKAADLFESRMTLARSLGVGVFQEPAEIKALFELAYERQPSKMIEIGSYQGGTALVLAGALKRPAKLLLIDFPHHRAALAAKLAGTVDYIRSEGFEVEYFNGASSSSGAYAAAKNMGGAGFMFIDGCHGTKMVIHDYMAYRDYILDGGLITFHDVLRQTRRAWAFMTTAWGKQGLKSWTIKQVPYVTRGPKGIGVVEWNHSAMNEPEKESYLLEVFGKVKEGDLK